MKNFKKILIVACIFALLFVGCAVIALATEEYTGTVDELTALVVKAEEADKKETKLKALQDVSNYLIDTPVDPSAEGYADLLNRTHVCALTCFDAFVEVANDAVVTADNANKALTNALTVWNLFELPTTLEGYDTSVDNYDAAVIKCASLLLSKIDANIETTLKTANNRVAINIFNAFVKNHPLMKANADEVYADINAQYKVLLAAHNAAVKINLEALDSTNELGAYDLPTYKLDDWDGNRVYNIPKDSEYINEWYFTRKATQNDMGIAQEPNGNKYAFSAYAPTSVEDYNTFFQLSLSNYSAENGYVMSFDLTTFDALPENGITIETGSIDGTFFPPGYFNISNQGDISAEGKGVILQKAIVPGEWINITIVFNASEFTRSIIVDGEVLVTYSALKDGKTYDHSKVAIRIAGKSYSGSIAMDNFLLYSGSNYRNLTKFRDMTDDEKFVYYSHYFSDETRAVNGRNDAYSFATALLSTYWTWTDEENRVGEYTPYAENDPELVAAVDRYLAFDFEELLANTKLANLDTYIKMVLAVDAMDRTPANVSVRKTKLNEIDTFALNYKDLINKEYDKNENGLPEYSEYNAIALRLHDEVSRDENAAIFVRHMNNFSKVSTLSALQRHYERAKLMVDDGMIDISLATDVDHPDRANFPEFIAAYEAYLGAAAHVKEVSQNENAEKIVACINFINGYKTEEEWLANSELMNKYINLVRDVVSVVDEDGDLLYNEYYTGIAEALEFYEEVYAFFFALLQNQHVEYLTDILNKIAETDAYIEKMGMVALIERYIASNEVDFEDPRIISIVDDTATCRAELELRREDYSKLLRQNAVYFINVVEYMRTAQTYADQKKYFDEATLLYYNIDITVEGAANAAAIYDEYAIKLNQIEKASLAFIAAVDIYKACETEEDKYAALVECYYNAQFVEMSYEGAKEAMDYYLAEYNAYMNYAEAVNADVAASGNAIGSLRVNCGITHVIAIIIKKVFGE